MQVPYRTLKKMKVLVGTPHAESKNYCLPQYVNNIQNLTYKHKNVLVVDNSASHNNQKLIRSFGLPCYYIKKNNKSTRQLLAESSEHLRERTLKGGYDFLLMYEDDLTPPINVIERLLSHQLPVVSASYHIGFGSGSHIMVQEIENGIVAPKTINVAAGCDGKYRTGKLMEVYACGLGMTLIHRSILEQIQFRYEPKVDAHPDTFFAVDLYTLGIKQYLDTSILCKHDNRDWSLVENK